MIPYPYSLTGLIFIVAGLFSGFVTNSILLKKKTSTKPFGIPDQLVTSGPFKWSRNPIYLGMALALLTFVYFFTFRPIPAEEIFYFSFY